MKNTIKKAIGCLLTVFALALVMPAIALASTGVPDVGLLVSLGGLLEAAPAWLVAITGVCTACTAITALTPTKADDKILNTILKVLNFLAGNFIRNKNADA